MAISTPSFQPVVDWGNGIYSLLVQPDGKIIVGGYGLFWDYSKGRARSIARFNLDGSADPSFGPETWVEALGFWTTGLQSDGKILLSGNFGSVNGVSQPYLARLNPDGSLDADFPRGLDVQSPTQVVPLKDGKILVIGWVGDAEWYFAFGRLNADGSLDHTFAPAMYAERTG